MQKIAEYIAKAYRLQTNYKKPIAVTIWDPYKSKIWAKSRLPEVPTNESNVWLAPRKLANKEIIKDEPTKPSTSKINNKANFSEPDIDTNTEDMKDIVGEFVEDEKPTYLAIKKVLDKYILLYQGKETPMVIEDEYPIVRGMGSGKFLTIGTAKVVKIKGTAVALKPNLERRYQPVTILDRVEYIQKDD